MAFTSRSQGPLTHYEAWQRAEDHLRTQARLVWHQDKGRAADLIEAAEKIRESRLDMSLDYAGQY